MAVHSPKKILLTILGCLSLVLGSLGIVLPILPTTPFVLIAAYCFVRSSEKLHTWLLAHPRFGPVIRRVEQGQGISLRMKLYSLGAAYVLVGITFIAVDILFVRIFLILLMCIKTVFMIYYPTYREKQEQGTPENLPDKHS